jgi:hypothetical protein
MTNRRSPRFQRCIPEVPFELTSRDCDILRLFERHRFLRSHHIGALVGGSAQQILRRLALLFHHGYLERPRAQLTYYHRPGSRHIVYGLGNKGGSLVKREAGAGSRRGAWGEKNRAIGRMFLEHALCVSDVMVTLELACRRLGTVRVVYESELTPCERRRPFQWRVQISPATRLGVVPDQVFALESNGATGVEQQYFFLEADRGTMPVKRRSLVQTSMHLKFLAYAATWAQNLHHTKFGFHRFRVLVVTKSEARRQSLVESCAQLERGRGSLLFANKSVLENPDLLFAPVWQTGRPNESACLFVKPVDGKTA